MSHPCLPCVCRSFLSEVMRESGLPNVRSLWTVDGKLGGWNKVLKKFFDDEVRRR